MAAAIRPNKGDSRNSPIPAHSTSKLRVNTSFFRPRVSRCRTSRKLSGTRRSRCRLFRNLRMPHNFSHCGDYVVPILVRHPRRKRERDHSLVFPPSHREICGLVSILVAVVAVQMHVNKMNGSPDVPAFQFRNKIISRDAEALQVEPEYLEMPGLFHL